MAREAELVARDGELLLPRLDLSTRVMANYRVKLDAARQKESLLETMSMDMLKLGLFGAHESSGLLSNDLMKALHSSIAIAKQAPPKEEPSLARLVDQVLASEQAIAEEQARRGGYTSSSSLTYPALSQTRQRNQKPAVPRQLRYEAAPSTASTPSLLTPAPSPFAASASTTSNSDRLGLSDRQDGAGKVSPKSKRRPPLSTSTSTSTAQVLEGGKAQLSQTAKPARSVRFLEPSLSGRNLSASAPQLAKPGLVLGGGGGVRMGADSPGMRQGSPKTSQNRRRKKQLELTLTTPIRTELTKTEDDVSVGSGSEDSHPLTLMSDDRDRSMRVHSPLSKWIGKPMLK